MANLLAGLLMLFAAVIVTPAVTIATMIYGWGLTPVNWWVIIGGWMIVMSIAAIGPIVSMFKN